MNVIKEKFIKELQTEAQMREKVWQKCPGTTLQFVSQQHTDRYAMIVVMKQVFEEMTDREFVAVIQRIQQKEADAKAQMSLF